MGDNRGISQAEIDHLKSKAEAIHRAALNLALTYGVFHGINSLRGRQLMNARVAAAIASIQHDLLHLMSIRVCALCDVGKWSDDASILALERGVTAQVRAHLIDAEQRFRRAVGARATRTTDVAKGIAGLRRQCTTLRKEAATVKRVKHFRDKLLAHVTVGHDPANKVMLRELWRVCRVSLSAARCIRAAFASSDWDYHREVQIAQGRGKALIRAIVVEKIG